MVAVDAAGLDGAFAGLEVVVAGLMAVAGLGAGAFRSAAGLCAKTAEAVTHKAVNVISSILGLMVAGILGRENARRQACAATIPAFLLL